MSGCLLPCLKFLFALTFVLLLAFAFVTLEEDWSMPILLPQQPGAAADFVSLLSDSLKDLFDDFLKALRRGDTDADEPSLFEMSEGIVFERYGMREVESSSLLALDAYFFTNFHRMCGEIEDGVVCPDFSSAVLNYLKSSVIFFPGFTVDRPDSSLGDLFWGMTTAMIEVNRTLKYHTFPRSRRVEFPYSGAKGGRVVSGKVTVDTLFNFYVARRDDFLSLRQESVIATFLDFKRGLVVMYLHDELVVPLLGLPKIPPPYWEEPILSEDGSGFDAGIGASSIFVSGHKKSLSGYMTTFAWLVNGLLEIRVGDPEQTARYEVLVGEDEVTISRSGGISLIGPVPGKLVLPVGDMKVLFDFSYVHRISGVAVFLSVYDESLPPPP